MAFQLAGFLVLLVSFAIANDIQLDRAAPYPNNCSKATVFVNENSEARAFSLPLFTPTYHTLKDALRHTLHCNNITIYIIGNITLNETIHIQKRWHRSDSLQIRGISSYERSNITCGWEFKGKFNESSDGAGIVLKHVHNVLIANVNLIKCGAISTKTGIHEIKKSRFQSAIYIWNCTNVTFFNVLITKSNGIGMMILNTYGNISVINCTFKSNTLWSNYAKFQGNQSIYGGGGVYVCMNGNNATYLLFQKCDFISNYKKNGTTTEHTGPMGGGGIFLYFRSNARNVTVKIVSCFIYKNTAKWGGGLHIGLLRRVKNIMVTVQDTKIYRNFASLGGGGTDASFTDFPHFNPPTNITIVFHNVFIKYNKAMFGGGTSIASSHYSKPLDISVHLTNCTWEKNLAYISAAAVDISPNSIDEVSGGIPLEVSFTNCNFIKNSFANVHKKINIRFYDSNFAIFLITSMTITFYGQTNYIDNNGTALLIHMGFANFNSSSKVTFKNNHSNNKGGAIALYGMGFLQFKDNSYFMFEGNTAEIGGAVYAYMTDPHQYIYSHTCFFRYSGYRWINTRNATFAFRNNTAYSGFGHSIFTSTLKPCMYSCHNKLECIHKRAEDMFKCCVAGFEFEMKSNEINTNGIHLNATNTKIQAIPGQTLQLNPQVIDETNSTITKIVIFKVSSNDNNVTFPNTVTSTGEVTILGEENSHGQIKLETKNFRSVAITFNITLTRCPPAYIYNEKDKSCQCQRNEFNGLQCDPQRNDTASFISPKTWVGYENDHVVTAGCPVEYCRYDNLELQSDGLYKLPKNFSETSLCLKGRRGTLCGECIPNYSVLHHSLDYQCDRIDHSCKYGVLIYIISELIPVTLIFVVIILCNINFTSGALNGFILFAQVVDLCSFNEHFAMSNPLKYFFTGQRIFYGLFNLKLDGIKYCLWENMTSLDILMVKYITTGYSLMLIVTLVIILRYCSCSRVYSLCVWQRGHLHVSMLHGISTFLIMCYSQCTRVTLLTLRGEKLWTKGPEQYNKKVVYMSGSIEWFGPEHLKYALPAIFFLIVLVILPPAILLFNSLAFQIVHLLNKRGIRIQKKQTNILLMNNLKPLLDSFQGCFQDNYRCFAGLYFVYRAVLSYNVPLSNPLMHTIINGTVFVLMILAHAIVQPYRIKWHNVLDTCLFVNLTTISTITAIILNGSSTGHVDKGHVRCINALKWVQAFLLYLPIAYIIVYVVYYLRKCCKGQKRMSKEKEHYSDIENWPDRLLTSNKRDYGSFHENN